MNTENQHQASKKLTVNATLSEIQEAGKGYLARNNKSFDWRQAAKDLHDLTGAHYVMVCDYEEAENALITKAVDGIPMKVEAVIHLLGVNVIGRKWVLFDGVKEELLKPEITVIGSVMEASSYNLPDFISFSIEKLLGVGAIYSNGFVCEGKLMGNYVLFMGRNQEITSFSKVNELEKWIVKAIASCRNDTLDTDVSEFDVNP